MTGRDIMQIDIAAIRDKFYGETEKFVKEIFDSYAEFRKSCSVAPILLFNEADAILSVRTSIFDYTNMPKHQLWMNGGLFDGGKCNDEQRKLFSFYSKLLNFRNNSKAISEGAFYDLMWCNPW